MGSTVLKYGKIKLEIVRVDLLKEEETWSIHENLLDYYVVLGAIFFVKNREYITRKYSGSSNS